MVDKEYPDHFPPPYGDLTHKRNIEVFPTHGERVVAAYHEPPPAVEFELKIALSALPKKFVDELLKTLTSVTDPMHGLPEVTVKFTRAHFMDASMETSIGKGAFLTLRGQTRYDSVVDIRPPGR